MKTFTGYDGKPVPHYQDADLHQGVIDQARELWRQRCAETMARNPHEGTCVLGAGIEVWYSPPRSRKGWNRKMIISAHSVTHAQGSLIWEDSVKEILAFLKENGIEASYNPGRMD